MCGNFGLLLLKQQEHTAYHPAATRVRAESDEDASLHLTMREVERLGGIRVSQPMKIDGDMSDHSAHINDSVHTTKSSLDASYHSLSLPQGTESDLRVSTGRNQILDPVKILEAQIAATEIRGGQAGGISSIEYDLDDKHFLDPLNTRVRCVARKRIALSSDLATLYNNNSTHNQSRLRKTRRACNMTFIGHTRFATSSINRVPELHPHEWVSFHSEGIMGVHFLPNSVYFSLLSFIM